MKCPTNLRWSVLHKIIIIMEVSNLLLCARGTYSVKKILNRFFWSVFSRNWTEYDKSPYSVQISEKIQENWKFGNFSQSYKTTILFEKTQREDAKKISKKVSFSNFYFQKLVKNELKKGKVIVKMSL